METSLNFLESKIYDINDIELILDEIKDSKLAVTNKGIKYYNIPCAFDIETSSFIFRPDGKTEKKCACMYIWMLGINGKVITGRTWEEAIYLFNKISEYLSLDLNKRMIFYVHNLGYEFQFFRKWLEWEKVFSIKKRRPVYGVTDIGIEFKCSYFLTGYSLKKVGENLTKYKIEKKSGDLDYSLIRNSLTPLSDKEYGYCVNDVLVVMAKIQELIEIDGDITRIPLTKTGYVRTYCRNMCMYEGSHKKNPDKYRKYRMLMDSLRLEPSEYSLLNTAFLGGFTHANAQYARKIMRKVRSLDFTSSYPYVIFSEKFPMSKGEFVKIQSTEQFFDLLSKYCCVFEIEFFDIYATTFIENYIPSSHCRQKKKVVENNGRVVSAEHVTMTITEIDYRIISKMYTWGKVRIHDFVIYRKSYLPTNLMKAMLKLYADKTILKGVKGKEVEYLNSKEMINAIFGMMVTDICRDDIIYGNDNWTSEKPDLEKAVSKINSSKKRFLFYAWGIYVTAYARMNLFTGILEFGNDYIYSDTDSIKVLNYDKHERYIRQYNDMVRYKLQKACDFHVIDMSMCSPKTINGVEKTLGVWDDEGEYSVFKTLGAKRYMVSRHDVKNRKVSISFTVSGLNKKICIPYLLRKYKTDIFKKFDNELYVPKGKTGKNTLTYVDEEYGGVVTDYLGNTCEWHEKSYIHMEEADYSLSFSRAFLDYLLGIEEVEE